MGPGPAQTAQCLKATPERDATNPTEGAGQEGAAFPGFGIRFGAEAGRLGKWSGPGAGGRVDWERARTRARRSSPARGMGSRLRRLRASPSADSDQSGRRANIGPADSPLRREALRAQHTTPGIRCGRVGGLARAAGYARANPPTLRRPPPVLPRRCRPGHAWPAWTALALPCTRHQPRRTTIPL